jgi:transposase-like protein
MTGHHPNDKPGNALSDETKAKVVELCRAGTTRNDIARQLGIAQSSVSGIVKRAGLTFDRKRVAAATAARKADLATRRQRIIDRGYKRVETLQDRLDARTFHTLQKTRGGGEVAAELKFVPSVDEKNLATTIASYIGTVTRLEQLDAGDAAVDVKSMLTDLGRALGLVQ